MKASAFLFGVSLNGRLGEDYGVHYCASGGCDRRLEREDTNAGYLTCWTCRCKDKEESARMYCPECETPMVERIDPDSGGYLLCPKCGAVVTAQDDEEW